MSELVKMNSGALVSWNTPENVSLIRETYAKGLNDQQFNLYLAICFSRGFNPMANHIYGFISQGKVVTCTGIDGLRSLADSSGCYFGSSTPFYEYNHDGSLKSCTVTVKKLVKGQIGEFSAIIYLDEFKNSNPNWKTKEKHMSAIRAESHALRKGFPEKLSGIYLKDEVEDEDFIIVKEKKKSIKKEVIIEKSKEELEEELNQLLDMGRLKAKSGYEETKKWFKGLSQAQQKLIGIENATALNKLSKEYDNPLPETLSTFESISTKETDDDALQALKRFDSELVDISAEEIA